MKKIILNILLVFTIKASSQSFYVNTVDNFQLNNKIYQLDISHNNETTENICPPTNNIGQYFENTYTDIAIDKNNNMYYVSAWGSLYKKNHNDLTCHYLGKFGPNIGSINSLVADSNDFIYASGNLNGVGMLYKYNLNSGIFYEIGNLPLNYIPSGDLFFYNNRLFLTCINKSNSTSCILEINLIYPLHSCFYMNINNEALGAFSIDYGSYSKTYLITSNLMNSSSIYEVDMPNKQVGNLVRSYNYIIYGAASEYNLKSNYSTLQSNLSSNSPICIGSTLELKASGGTDYLWTGTNGFTSTDQNPIIQNATALNRGQYSCLITGTGCDDTKTIDVIVGDTQDPIPDLATLPTITGDCQTQITTIPTATNTCAGSIIATTISPLSYSLPGNYTIVWNYNDGNDNSVNQNQTVTITNQPLPSSTSLQTFCIQQNATLSSILITGQNIKWYDTLTNGNLLANTPLLQNGITYYASQTINGCESERIPITVIINESSLPTTTSPQTFCIQQNATLNSITITGQNIKWYDALTNGNLLSNTTSLQNGKTYYASQTINGCESERIAVLINIQNTAAPTGDTNQSFCSTQNATLNDIEITGTNIKWYNSSNIELPNTTVLSNNATYYATQSINNCESVNKLAVNTTLINTLNANNYKVEFCDENNDGRETLNLSVFSSNLIANPADNSFSYYTSLAAAENQIANNRINNINNYVLPTGSYTVFVRIDSPNGCHQVVELGLNLYSKPIIPIDNIMPICEGSSIDINAGNGYDNYLWSTGETSPSITIQNPGNYSVTVTNDYDSISCSSTKDFTVKKSTVATITTIETQDWTDNQNTIKVFVTGEGDFEYSIDGIHFQDSNEFSNVITGQYTVQVRDKNGCGTVTDEVYLLMYPRFFTPNGDGYNDTWKIKFSDSEKNITIKIFDRYGKLLKQLLPDASWNGQFNNQELPATDYWFIVTRADGKEYKGHFSLKR